jgi:hypothetical protein
MLILRHTSPMFVPPSACWSANAIRCSVKFDFFVGQPPRHRIEPLAGFCHSERSDFRGGAQFQGEAQEHLLCLFGPP